MNIGNLPVLLNLAPWVQRGAAYKAVLWINPARSNRAPSDAPSSVLDISPDDVVGDSPAMAFVIGRLKQGLCTGLRFASLHDGACAFDLLANTAAIEAAQ